MFYKRYLWRTYANNSIFQKQIKLIRKLGSMVDCWFTNEVVVGSSSVAVTHVFVLLKKINKLKKYPTWKITFLTWIIINFLTRFVGFLALFLLNTKCFTHWWPCMKLYKITECVKTALHQVSQNLWLNELNGFDSRKTFLFPQLQIIIANSFYYKTNVLC